MDTQHDAHLGDPKLLAKMDKLRETRVGEYIPLPQVGHLILELQVFTPLRLDRTACRRR